MGEVKRFETEAWGETPEADEKLEFILAGKLRTKDADGVEVFIAHEVTFRILPSAPGGALLHYAGAGTDEIKAAARLQSYLEGCLYDEAEVERFRATINSKDFLVDGRLLAEIARWLTVTYAATKDGPPRPTTRSEKSPSGPRSTGTTSSPASTSPVGVGSPKDY